MHMWLARTSESKTFLEDAFSFSWEKHCVVEALCGPKRKRWKPFILRLSAAFWHHSCDAGLPKKKQTSCRRCRKKKQQKKQKNKTKKPPWAVWKLQGLCLWHMLKASLFEMSPGNWVKTTLCNFYKKELIYYVDITLIRQVTEY